MPHSFENLKIPAIAAPMFLTSGPDLVVEACKAGVLGTFPALNQRTTEGFGDWLTQIEERLAEADKPAPYGVNIIVHPTNSRVRPDLELCVKHKVPLVITSLGAVKDVVDAVHSYGGKVFHDVIKTRHAEKAVEAGVDGLIAVCAGAGGHGGTLSPFGFLPEIRSFFDGTIVLSGSISNGAQIASARAMGADLAYLGTRFIATEEAMSTQDNKDMIVGSKTTDILYTPNISGVNANFMRQSIEAAGLDPDNLPPHEGMNMESEAKAWKNIWSAGHGVAAIDDVLPTAELCARLTKEYRETCAMLGREAD
ncbi:Nitronate monooxygenase [Rhodobacteraceae bacterium THAF1]|uniref:NAD(P)H-dependent flavin oxidoreductase n=1 Tax=Palleronia sp. THAF1 TaxID=2587842 RepID=UPI000F404611|nr:nitronate monooxygenase [Palleronia sp. THAF1]QFU09028.1 Nitronate monooxygenase [Palleronia sp. THAF1]VDC24213.1 Nitronate monooxygenase [Rhodobacteraceae bacterium THAF1]